MHDEQRTVLVRITGRVQGVWFRGWVSEKAHARGLTGWVRNRRDGSVEAQFSGSADLIDEMIEKCGQGPVLANVREISVTELDVTDPDGPQAFEIRATG